jgi:two-component system sensor histidine kinase ChiS
MSKLVILCIDDEKMVLDSLKEQLRSGLDSSYLIEMAESAEEALEIIEEITEDRHDLSVVICDQIMPGLKGDEFLKIVHERSSNTLKILLTGQADALAVGNAVNYANLYRYIAKPWQATDLILTVKEALRSYVQDKKLTEQNISLQKINEELTQLNRAYERFVPGEFLRLLERSSIVEVALGDQIQTEVTILFSDIRSFTTLSEQMTPQENFDFINAYLGRISPIIRNHNGFIDKFIGDAIMALFPAQADDAIQAAINMQQSVSQYNSYRQNMGRQPINIGIGLHTGKVMLGTIGETARMEGTVISDAVNLAARLEGLTKLYAATILISEQTLFSLDRPNRYHFRFLDRVKVKGRAEPISVFEILDGSSAEEVNLKLETRTQFEKGLLHYHSQEFAAAQVIFNEVLDYNPQDQAARIYRERAAYFAVHGVPPDWSGIEILVEK